MFLSNPCYRSIDRYQLLGNEISDPVKRCIHRYPDMGAILTNHGFLSFQSGELTRNRGCCGTHSRNTFQLQFRSHESAGNPKVEIDSFGSLNEKTIIRIPGRTSPNVVKLLGAWALRVGSGVKTTPRDFGHLLDDHGSRWPRTAGVNLS